MKKQIEVEFIGNLTKERFNELKEFFNENGKFKEEKDRFQLVYFRDKIPKDLREIKDEKVDLKLRVTNKKVELILKYGLFTASHARKEISIRLNNKDFENCIEILNYLNWSNAVIDATKTYVYNYKNIEFSLVETKEYGYNFEAEILTNKNNVDDAKKKIMPILKELSLRPFTQDEIFDWCNKMNNDKKLMFNFNKDPIEEIREKYKEFF